ncbi:hypothetical protein K3495_g200 [Podosphaera aphanis]|nr:hypothetical protein K3495_g200 [Podosphaera aphanis]
MGYIINSQEPKEEDILPVDDVAWDSGQIAGALQSVVSTTTLEQVAPFSRLCQASILLGQVMAHLKTEFPSETSRFSSVTQLYANISDLALKVSAESTDPKKFFNTMSPLALTYSTLCFLCKPYCFRQEVTNQEQQQIQAQATEGLKSVAVSIIDFVEQINIATSSPTGLDCISPLIMDAIYAGALTLAWLARDSGDETCQTGLESLRQCLGKLSTRWRNAAEYLRILEAQEFAFALSQNNTS